MNENSGEMPNPLNPNPGSGNNTLDTSPSEPIENISANTPNAASPANAGTQPISDPMARPMERAPEPEVAVQPKKKKTGLIVGIIVGAVVLIGGIIAAVLLLNMNTGDPVSKAVAKIVSGDAPEYVTANGSLDFTPQVQGSPITNINLALNVNTSTKSMINSSTAKLTASLEDGNDISISFEEIFAENGDLYLKIDGAKTAAEDYIKLMSSMQQTTTGGSTDCIDYDEYGNSEVIEDCVQEEVVSPDENVMEAVAALSSALSVVDGQYLRVTTDDLSSLSSESLGNNDMSCLVKLTGDIKNNSNTFAEMYSNNSFIESTTEGVNLASKSGNPVYRVTIDKEKLTAFLDSFQNSSAFNDFKSCIGSQNGDENSESLIAEVDKMPALYVEVDNDYNFTRLYFEHATDDSDVALKTDLDFSYPNSINVAEPAEYKDLKEVIQELFTSMYTLPEKQTGGITTLE